MDDDDAPSRSSTLSLAINKKIIYITPDIFLLLFLVATRLVVIGYVLKKKIKNKFSFSSTFKIKVK